MDAVTGQRRIVFERIGRVARLAQVAAIEGVLVEDQRAALLEVAQVRLERRRVHGDQRVDRVAGRVDVVGREAELKTADAGERAGGGANFGRKVGQRADVVAEHGRRVGELRAGQLHAVAAVAAEPDDDGFQRFDLFAVETLWGPVSVVAISRSLLGKCRPPWESVRADG